ALRGERISAGCAACEPWAMRSADGTTGTPAPTGESERGPERAPRRSGNGENEPPCASPPATAPAAGARRPRAAHRPLSGHGDVEFGGAGFSRQAAGRPGRPSACPAACEAPARASSEGRRGRVPPPSDQSAVSTQTICSPTTMTVSWSSDQPGTSAQPWRKPPSSVEEPSEYAWPSTEYRAFAARQGVSTSSAPDRPGGAWAHRSPHRSARGLPGDAHARGAASARRSFPEARRRPWGPHSSVRWRRRAVRPPPGNREAIGRGPPRSFRAGSARGHGEEGQCDQRQGDEEDGAGDGHEGQDDGLGLLTFHIAWSNRGS